VEPTRTSNLITVHPTPEWLAIFRHAGVDLLAYDGARASDATGPLADAARRIQNDPAVRRPLLPAGEPSAGLDAVQVLEWAASRCADDPAATFRVKMRDAHSTRGPS
jgi:hypothetical protein